MKNKASLSQQFNELEGMMASAFDAPMLAKPAAIEAAVKNMVELNRQICDSIERLEREVEQTNRRLNKLEHHLKERS